MRGLAFLAAFVLAAGCAPEPVFHLTARDSDARWRQGRQWVRHESGGVSLVASFDRTLGGCLVFDVLVVNRSDSPILIEPEAFNFTLASSGRELRAALRHPYPAVDPEAQLARIDKYLSAIEAGHATGRVLDAIGGLGNAVLEVAEAGTRTEADQERDAQLDLERACERHEADEAHESAIATLSQARDYWASRALRRTQLDPRQSVRGKIALPTGPMGRLLAGIDRSRSITTFVDEAALTPREVLILTLHSPMEAETEGIEFIVRRL